MTTTEQRVPPTLHLSDFDDDDAFDVNDDSANPSYVFSPDSVREEMARNMPLSAETWAPSETSASTGQFFLGQNRSVSTLDIESADPRMASFHPPSLSPHDADTFESEAGSSHMSDNFSRISLSTHGERRPEDDEDDDADVAVDTHQVSPPNGHGSLSFRNGFAEVVDASPSVADVAEPETPPWPRTPSPTSSQRKASPSRSTPLPPPPMSAPVVDTRSSPEFASRPSPPHTASVSTSSAIPSISLPTIASTSATSDNVGVPLSEKTFTHKPNRSAGPSMFEKVRSKTRPTFLPPKTKKEDEKHLADWQEMMKQSRITAEKRRKALQERRLAREKAIDENIHVWERDILPDWRVVNKNASLRKLWWKGIPEKLRAQLWQQAVGNDLALSKDNYRSCLSRAKRALNNGSFPQASLDLMERDIDTTLPQLHIFMKETGPLHDDLKDILYAWVVARSDEGMGYTMGASKIAAMLLINMSAQQAFVVMRNLLERHCLRSFFGGERVKDDVEAYYRIFDTMLADGMPKIYFNFKQHQVSPGAYLPDWVVSLFLDHLPFEACARIWDVIILEGDSFLYRAALGILAVLEPRLFFPDRKELLELLRGENKAAIEVAKREALPLNGGKYEIYGVDEETLWDRIESMDDWWKDSTWTRLIQRELPDI
ncbi:hypothetical protein D9619_002799 [Psilocybe cf. subviscida]|uniref:Rab-GAP TBC domain-containing protein n=1 Tax=Psilocybe cf. subviscida TaxID=2480587 RepID=A0A8H5AWK0_9AGAR|nr:hypothetical protein D9619_002799 [Psilocybe cf. subviscida]